LAVAHRLHQPVWRTWLQSAWHPSDEARRSDLVSALNEVDLTPLATWRTAEAFAGAVSDSVDRAMYWQPPDDEDVVAAKADVITALQPIAHAIARSPSTAWWTGPIDLENQWIVDLHEPAEPATSPAPGNAAAKLAEWRRLTIADNALARRDRPADPAAHYGGWWWSSPIGTDLLRTTGTLPAAGPAQLYWEEDGFGLNAATVWTTEVHGIPRVYEIRAPEDWVSLTRRYPLDVTDGRKHDWFKVTGCDGTWHIPDWERVSRDWDAVHLTVAGYLTTATRLLGIDDRTATVLAGWNPDETFWLSDLLTPAGARPQQWSKLDGPGMQDPTWHQQT
jgi:hypothetical protein